MKAAVPVVLLLLSAACGREMGPRINLDLVKRYIPGVTTKADVERDLGPASTITTINDQQNHFWIWSDVGSRVINSITVEMRFTSDGRLLEPPIRIENVTRRDL